MNWLFIVSQKFFYKKLFVLFFGVMPCFATVADPGAVLHPDVSTSRVLIKRSYEDYARQCAERKEPTRLVVACGRLGHPIKSFNIGGETYYECEGHSDTYFTIDISADMHPDILGNVFNMEDQAFRPKSWDFIVFEGISVFFDCYSEQFLRTLARSLRTAGVWILNFNLHFFPPTIKIGDGTFNRVGTQLDEYNGSAIRTICHEAGKMENPETAVFESFDEVRTTVNNFFTKLGFRSAEIRNTFLLSAEKNPEDFALVAGLSGEYSPGGGLFGADIDHLIGPELLPTLKRNLEELALVIRA